MITDRDELYRRMKLLKFGKALSREILVSDTGWLVRECAQNGPSVFRELVGRLRREKGSVRANRVKYLEKLYRDWRSDRDERRRQKAAQDAS
jgi:hypothetical protein